jgi:1-deoxy-D-xylulose-5-phosphate reductoisomerase
MKRVVILGATGSIGTQALDVVASHPDLRVVALAAHSNVEALLAAAGAHRVDRVALVDEAAADRARRRFDGDVLAGSGGVVELVRDANADIVLNAIVGAAGLAASLATLAAGADLALANKESLVAGGPLVLAAVAASGRRLLPVDSEHSALLQCLAGDDADAIERLWLTASGGPFRGHSRDALALVTRADALRHPTWRMGAKITIDSATLMNKGLEVIEAHFLFGLDYDRISVVIHPQSVVHGLVALRDGALIAHLGLPDMRVPISYALCYPQRAATTAPRLDLTSQFTLEFAPPDTDAFPCLALARAAATTGGSAPCILNAANESAVAAFLDDRIGFGDIAALVADALDAVPVTTIDSIEMVAAADDRARRVVEDRLAALA